MVKLGKGGRVAVERTVANGMRKVINGAREKDEDGIRQEKGSDGKRCQRL